MLDQLIIGDKGSFDDFGASLAKRNIGQPKKKSIKETVPYSNTTYDFSAINGELYWEQRTLEYVFEMTANTPEDLEDMKSAFSSWIMNVMNEEIHDPFIFGYHFFGTFEDIKYEDDDGLDKTTATVTFAAYPYKISNIAKRYAYSVNAGATIELTIINDSAHRIAPIVNATAGCIIKKDTASAIADPPWAVTDESWAVIPSLGGKEIVNEDTGKTFMVEKGMTVIQVQNPNGGGITFELSFHEEVM